MIDLYFEPNYGKLYEKNENGVCEVFEFSNSIGKISNMFIKREIPMKIDNGTYYDIVTPYGYGGPIINECKEGHKTELVHEYKMKFQQYCYANNIVSEFVRFHPIIENSKDFINCYDISNIRNTVGTNLVAYDDPFQSEFSKSCRKNIKKSLKEGVSYKITEKPNNVHNFKEIYYSTMNRNEADSYYYFDDEYFSKCIELLGENIILVEAIYQEKTIAIGLYFTYDKTIHIHLSGTLSEFLYLSPAYVLRYAITLWGKENGYKLIHHGGGRSNASDDSLYLFKKQFGKNTEFEFYIGRKIWNEKIYHEINQKVGVDKNTEFFPAYRCKNKVNLKLEVKAGNIMQDILIIAHFTQVPGEVGNGRFHYIAEKINKENASVEIVTTSFSHRIKKQRKVTDDQLNSISYKITMLEEPGYHKNVSLKRFYSHYRMGKRLREYLEERKKPDVIYCSVPSLDVGKIAAKYAKDNNIRFIIDVQDLWPEAFKMVFHVPVISDILYYPMQRQADYIYNAADEIVAVSQTYVNRALKVNNKCKKGYSIFLGTELSYFDRLVEDNKLIDKPENEIWLAYIGTLGSSYDLKCVIDALRILQDRGIRNIKFIVMGDGLLKFKFENYANEQGIYAEFTGRLNYGKMVGVLTACDIAVNPIRSGSAGSIINKVGDYAAAGLPVLNTQECLEYRNLVDEYKMGINCENNNSDDLSKKIMMLYSDKQFRKDMGKNNRKLAEERFDRKKSYLQILRLLGD